MSTPTHDGLIRQLPLWAAAAGAIVLAVWLLRTSDRPIQRRIPGTDSAPAESGRSQGNPILSGRLVPGTATHTELPGAWPQFRGPARDGIAPGAAPARSWPGGRPTALWSVSVGEGYAGPAVLHGRVYLMDYDRERKEDCLRCLSLADGRELWRYAYPVAVKRNHGMSRTVPAVTEEFVVAIGPKGHVVCCDAKSGELRWGLDLAGDFGAAIPEWYTGQCPLLDADRVVLAPGGPEALLIAVSQRDGSVVWTTPNPEGWKMTHSSVVTAEFGGKRQYVYCASKGVVGVDAHDGSRLWQTTDWKISIATVPSPCVLDNGRIFLSGGYNAGSLLLQLRESAEGLVAESRQRLDAETFGATQHTPVHVNGRLYGVRADGRFVCLDLDGNVRWQSGPGASFGLGPFLVTGNLIFALDDSGLLRLLELNPDQYRQVAEAQVIEGGRESWGPMALAAGKLLVRDFTRLVCLEVGAP